jgi:hypothetical protein
MAGVSALMKKLDGTRALGAIKAKLPSFRFPEPSELDNKDEFFKEFNLTDEKYASAKSQVSCLFCYTNIAVELSSPTMNGPRVAKCWNRAVALITSHSSMRQCLGMLTRIRTTMQQLQSEQQEKGKTTIDSAFMSPAGRWHSLLKLPIIWSPMVDSVLLMPSHIEYGPYHTAEPRCTATRLSIFSGIR